jgi:predicted small lipoprotein YifL
MKTVIYSLVMCGSVIVGGCGQKGALYLPDKNAAVVTRPAGSNTAPPQGTSPNSQQDQDKDKDKNKDESQSKSTTTPTPRS